MSDRIFTPAQKRPIRDYMTISRPAGLGPAVPVTWFSMGGGTSITPEAYDVPVLYLGGECRAPRSPAPRGAFVCTRTDALRHRNRRRHRVHRNHCSKGAYHEQHHPFR